MRENNACGKALPLKEMLWTHFWDRNQRNIVMAASEHGSYLHQNGSKQSYEFS